MSNQTMLPVNGGVTEVQTTVSNSSIRTLSRQYIDVNNLHKRPTEWVAGGRPIYRRLPAISQTYQIDWENEGEIGYCYIPWGEGIFGPNSLEVVASDSKADLFIKGGDIVWKYGKSSVNPALINLRQLDVAAGRYLIAYELNYNDEPFDAIYDVSDYSLAGEELTISSSTQDTPGWRYPSSNAFLNTSERFWTNYDSFFPSSVQPGSAYLQWERAKGSAYSKLVLSCPPGTLSSGSATLSYLLDDGSWLPMTTSEVSYDSSSNTYSYTLVPPTPSFQLGWRVDFTDTKIAIQSILVSGQVVLEKRPSQPQSKAVLSLFSNFDFITDSTLCKLAFVDVDKFYQVEDIIDIRDITHRDFEPVSDWLTRPFDEDLINLYEQVKNYPTLWMAPPSCMKQEYLALSKKGVIVE